MKKFKKLILAAVITALSFGLFAQQSKTNAATQGLFTTDVDNYMNVNEWSTVSVGKAFGYFGMPAGGGQYNLGFAKDFSKCYWGSYFSGQFGTLEIEENKTTTTVKDVTDGNTYFYFNNLFGFGNNMGLRIDTYYEANNSTSHDTGNASSKTESDKKDFYLGAVLGLGDKTWGKVNLKPYFGLGFESNVNNGTKQVNGNTTVDGRDWALAIYAGADIDLTKSENVKQNLITDLTLYFQNPVDSKNKYNSGSFLFPVTYKLVIKATDTLSFGVKAGLNLGITFGKNETNPTVIETFGFYANPTVAAGLTFDTKKKILLNAGVQFGIPGFSVNSTTSKASSTTTKNTTTRFNGNDGWINYSSGLTIKPTEKIVIDCSCNILGNLFANTSSTLTEGNNNFWNTVNKVLIHNITFEVSFKL